MHRKDLTLIYYSDINHMEKHQHLLLLKLIITIHSLLLLNCLCAVAYCYPDFSTEDLQQWRVQPRRKPLHPQDVTLLLPNLSDDVFLDPPSLPGNSLRITGRCHCEGAAHPTQTSTRPTTRSPFLQNFVFAFQRWLIKGYSSSASRWLSWASLAP